MRTAICRSLESIIGFRDWNGKHTQKVIFFEFIQFDQGQIAPDLQSGAWQWSNRMNFALNFIRNAPVGPLRCLATVMSAMPL